MYEEQMDRGVGTVTVPFRFKLSGETHCPEWRSGLLGIRKDAKTPWFRTDPVRPGARREPLARSLWTSVPLEREREPLALGSPE